jgi:excisionase family DNA binding protein
LGPTEAQIRGLIRAGRIAHVMVGKRIVVPREAIEAFVAQNTVLPCHDGTKAHDSVGSQSAGDSTFPGPNMVAAASARLARQTANKLKRSSQNGCKLGGGTTGQVIPLQSS